MLLRDTIDSCKFSMPEFSKGNNSANLKYFFLLNFIMLHTYFPLPAEQVSNPFQELVSTTSKFFKWGYMYF